MRKKRILSLSLAGIGIGMVLVSMKTVRIVTGAIIGSEVAGINTTSRIFGIIGICLMIIAVVVENHELKNNKNNEKRKEDTSH